MRWDSLKIKVLLFAKFANLSRLALLLTGKNPSKQKRSEAMPDAHNAVIAAQAPGNGTTRIFALVTFTHHVKPWITD